MLGCLMRGAVAVVLVAACAVGWFTRDVWVPRVRARLGSTPAVTASALWTRVTPAGAAKVRAALQGLRSPNGPVYLNVDPADLAAFALDSALLAISSSDARRVEAMARDDRLYLRTTVRVSDLGDAKALGPLVGVLEGPQELEIRGRLEVIKPGLAQFRVDQVRLRDITIPSAAIAKIIARLQLPKRDPALAADALPVQLPREVADVRVGKGRITLYKSLP